jgi:hypothetical protein
MTSDDCPGTGQTDTWRDDLDALLPWAARLPWVVVRSRHAGMCIYALDCPPLGLRRPWLVTGLTGVGSRAPGIAVIVPEGVARAMERVGWGRSTMQMPNRNQVVKVAETLSAAELSAVVVSAYRSAGS